MAFKEYTSLQIAVMYDHTDIMPTLMDYAADPNIFSKVYINCLALLSVYCGMHACHLI